MGTLQGYVTIFDKDKQDHHGYMYMYWHDMMLGVFIIQTAGLYGLVMAI